NFKSGSVRGLIATWGYYLKKKVCYGLYSTKTFRRRTGS
ncbi:hypothetical protein C5S35_13880, partial [Candidatus Methanophagaceae archaeon]